MWIKGFSNDGQRGDRRMGRQNSVITLKKKETNRWHASKKVIGYNTRWLGEASLGEIAPTISKAWQKLL